MRGGDRSLILTTGARLVVPTALLLSLYLLFAGHNQPGGGFVGGLVAGAALVLQSVEARQPPAVATSAWSYRLLGIGLFVAAGTAVASWPAGGRLLESGKLAADVPLLGTVKTTSAMAFDSGVYVVVVALVLVILGTLGAEEEQS